MDLEMNIRTFVLEELKQCPFIVWLHWTHSIKGMSGPEFKRMIEDATDPDIERLTNYFTYYNVQAIQNKGKRIPKWKARLQLERFRTDLRVIRDLLQSLEREKAESSQTRSGRTGSFFPADPEKIYS